MADVIYLSIIVAFFLIAYFLVIACDRIIGGPDSGEIDGETGGPQHSKKAA